MTWLLVGPDNLIENTIVADQDFAEKIGAFPYYDGAEMGKPYSPPYAPTTEERITALETAMLSMMGVNADV